MLDWSIGRGESQTAEPALAEIRAFEDRSRSALPAGSTTPSPAPVFITTGILEGTNASAVERILFPASLRYKAQISLKTARASLLAFNIKQALGAPSDLPP